MKADLIVQDPDRVSVSAAPLSDGRGVVVFSGGELEAGLAPLHVSVALPTPLLSKLRDEINRFLQPKGN